MGRHAYLIMAHDQFGMLDRLLSLLDDPRNDVYLHVDSKARDFDPGALTSAGRLGERLILVERMSVNWGGFSQIECELSLLRAASGKDYQYLHLLSGRDLPLKSQDEIHAFCDAHGGEEFIAFGKSAPQRERASLWHPLQEFRRRSSLANAAERALLLAQRIAGTDRLRGGETELYYGSQWFSVTGALARHVLESEAALRRQYRMTACCDEIFLQTLVMASPFREQLHHPQRDGGRMGNMRYVAWKNSGRPGSPRTLTTDDLDALMASGCMFARKFDDRVDAAVAEKITNLLKAGGKA